MDVSEFDLIDSCFAPLSKDYEEAYGLKNDAALISEHPDSSTVVTMDTLIAGVHFFNSDPADDIARKCLRVNLSDLAAMGAKPTAYTLSMAYSDDLNAPWVKSFVRGLDADQQEFSIRLIGGDTVKTHGPLTITITCFGSVPRHRCLKRNTATPGQDIWVSGTLGDSAAGLQILKGEVSFDNQELRDVLVHRYQVPMPRIGLGICLLNDNISNTAMDVSDGLLADLSHITKASKVGATVLEQKLPYSNALKALFSKNETLKMVELAVTGGDDYELLFTADKLYRKKINDLARKLSLKISCIGSINSDKGVSLIEENGNHIHLSKMGWKHF
ncbi:thiamine-phosphate kinase [Kiloniella antarctica]|uniref:Thiamine-monophosphate kinase n=1 Tax=Kiloniella antarctica TaxID=1550907 RepID=A0ABW5BS39_9PROT